jgi:hypothetical protein
MKLNKRNVDKILCIVSIILASLTVFCDGNEENGPYAQIDVTTNTGIVGDEVELTGANSTGDRLTYEWSFGTVPPGSQVETNTTNMDNVIFRFTPDRAGTYSITLTVTDFDYLDDTATQDIIADPDTSSFMPPGTGQETYYDNSGPITDPQDIALFPGQDAEQAEEVTFVVINDTSSGNPIIIRDPVTGWEWQADSISPLLTYDEAVAECDGLDLGGNSDWYLGSRPMLQSIVNYGIINNGEAATFEPFQDTTVAGQYWTTSPDVYSTGNRMMVDFGSFEGNMGASFPIAISLGGNDQTAYCRCVRGPEIPTDHSYVDNGDDTVTDQTTDLVFLKKPLAAVTAVGPFWQDALVYCDESTVGGYDDWIVPNIKQLASLTAFSQTQPPLLDDVFDLSDIQFNYEFCSSTTQWFEPSAAWTLRIDNGAIYPGFYAGKIAYECNVICVRKPDQ